ncbi:MAG: 2-dehydropantoate 2-reductase [Pyramidobacter porci]|uniref:ketopantoate reductase family protein n=1 Tax=Pyramidobacter porci TaxID=2605789 RepID=UPI002A74F547|nr:2-dehydropantoate 2-reductase [Pyramidobacter porci]MDY2648535.1 2-dehydropantoate 2-reductase [Pyramidobacter porci]
MKVGVFGIGGIGGFVGGALARIRGETYFCARGENLEAIRRGGLRVDSVKLGRFTARPAALSDDAAALGVMDALIVACKGYDLEASCAAMSPMVGAQTLVIPLLNGVVVSEQMEPFLPPCLLADGTIRVFSHLEAPGAVVQTAGQCSVVVGMKDGSRPAALDAAAELLNRAGIETKVTDHIVRASWNKYVTMGSNSCVFCWYDGPAGKVLADPDHKKVIRAVIDEMTAVAAAQGVELPASLSDKLIDAFEKMPADTVTSLYRDLRAGKDPARTELDHIIGRMVQLGRETGVPVPYHEAAYEKWRK